MPDIVHTLELFKVGEFDTVRVFKNLEGARREAARLLYKELEDSDQFAESAGVHDINEFYEFRDNMRELFEQESYHDMLVCWDEWVAENAFDDPTPFNFDISERPLE